MADAVKNAKAGQVQYRTDKAGIVQCTIGRASFTEDALKENLLALMDALNKSRPSGTKGLYLKKVSLVQHHGSGRAGGPGQPVRTAASSKESLGRGACLFGGRGLSKTVGARDGLIVG